MACQELQSGLAQVARPQSALTADARPEADGFCRSFDFSRPDIYTFAGEPIVTFAGEQLEVF